jgi:hypothetical protein
MYKRMKIVIPAPIYWRNNAPCANRQCTFYDSKITTLPIEAGPFGALIGNALYKIEQITPMPFDARPFGAPISNVLFKIEKITIFEQGRFTIAS